MTRAAAGGASPVWTIVWPHDGERSTATTVAVDGRGLPAVVRNFPDDRHAIRCGGWERVALDRRHRRPLWLAACDRVALGAGVPEPGAARAGWWDERFAALYAPIAPDDPRERPYAGSRRWLFADQRAAHAPLAARFGPPPPGPPPQLLWSSGGRGNAARADSLSLRGADARWGLADIEVLLPAPTPEQTLAQRLALTPLLAREVLALAPPAFAHRDEAAWWLDGNVPAPRPR